MKKILSLIIILILVCTTVYADVSIYTDNSYTVAPGGNIIITAKIKGDKNLSFLKLSLDSDTSVLSVASADNGEVFTEKSFFAGNINKMPHSSAWINNDKNVDSGDLVYFTLTVNDTVKEGVYPVRLFVNSGDALDMDGNVVEIPDFEFNLNVTGNPPQKKMVKGSISNIKKIRNYNDDFYDVIEDDWYYEDVKAMYELGFTEDGGAFNAFDKMTLDDTFELATMLFKAYYNEDVEYMNSDENKGVFITRAEFAYIMAHSLPSDAFEKINLSVNIPDVDESNEYYNDIYKLYAAGILVGGDENGSFYPDNTIERCEAAAFINRLGYIGNRVKIK